MALPRDQQKLFIILDWEASPNKYNQGGLIEKTKKKIMGRPKKLSSKSK